MQDLTGKCVKVENEKQAELLQIEAFKQGFSWSKGKVISYKDAVFFTFHRDKSISYNKLDFYDGDGQEIHYKNFNFVDLFIPEKPTLEAAALDLLKEEEKQRGLERSQYFKNLNELNAELQQMDEKNTQLKTYLFFASGLIAFLMYCLIFGEHC